MKSVPLFMYIVEMSIHLILDILMWKMKDWLLFWLSYTWAHTHSMCMFNVEWVWTQKKVRKDAHCPAISVSSLEVGWSRDGGLLATSKHQEHSCFGAIELTVSSAWNAVPRIAAWWVPCVYSHGIFLGPPWLL